MKKNFLGSVSSDRRLWQRANRKTGSYVGNKKSTPALADPQLEEMYEDLETQKYRMMAVNEV